MAVVLPLTPTPSREGVREPKAPRLKRGGGYSSSPLTGEGWGGGENSAPEYAGRLLAQLDSRDYRLPETGREHPARANARSGLMSLTGAADSEAVLCPAPIAACADGALLALQALATDAKALAGLKGSQLLTERAALMGLSRNGRIAPGGSCRLLDAADGRIAVNLARDEDWSMLPAWLEASGVHAAAGDWDALTPVIAEKPAGLLVERGRMMGLAVAAECLPPETGHWFELTATGPKASVQAAPLVVDLSTLWAGPLCGHLLQKLGARVIKLESASRPDGARAGNTEFYDLLNEGKQSLTLALDSATGRTQLLKLIAQADIVIESARPRGLRHMGIVAEELVAVRPGLTWISITGYGRDAACCDWVGFGDDAAVAAGLSGLMREVAGESMFVGDAIADPLTGMHAALAAWHSHIHGGGQLLSLALRDVTACCARLGWPPSTDALRRRHAAWMEMLNPDEVRQPQPRYASGSARPPGADNAALCAEFKL